MKRFVIGQDTTDLIGPDGKVIASYPRWTPTQQQSVMAAIFRSTPKGAGDSAVHIAERQSFRFRKPVAPPVQKPVAVPMRRRA